MLYRPLKIIPYSLKYALYHCNIKPLYVHVLTSLSLSRNILCSWSSCRNYSVSWNLIHKCQPICRWRCWTFRWKHVFDYSQSHHTHCSHGDYSHCRRVRDSLLSNTAEMEVSRKIYTSPKSKWASQNSFKNACIIMWLRLQSYDLKLAAYVCIVCAQDSNKSLIVF